MSVEVTATYTKDASNTAGLCCINLVIQPEMYDQVSHLKYEQFLQSSFLFTASYVWHCRLRQGVPTFELAPLSLGSGITLAQSRQMPMNK